MAGRGVTITVKLLGGGDGNSGSEDISLTVALHSPLEVLKNELSELVGIAPQDQVLILCDLSDPDRNSDVLLVGRDHMTLRQIGIAHESVLTLHPLGISAEQRLQMMREAFGQKHLDAEERPTFLLETTISPSQADHSYNGIIFDVECNGPYEIELLSVSIGGMLGRIRIFARDKPWRTQAPMSSAPDRWWAYREGLSREGWEEIADVHCRPSWDKPFEIKFRKPIKLLPRQRRALYCHSSLPDDLGIQYQTYGQRDIVAQDEYITLLPGLGHTGSDPFDDHHGWYRSYRGLAGGIRYTAKWKGWTIDEHSIFPSSLKDAVKTMLCCTTRSSIDPNQSFVPVVLAVDLSRQYSNSSTVSDVSNPSSRFPVRKRTSRVSMYHISSLPKDLIFYILEFMNYDWFRELEVTDLDQEAPPSSRKKNTLSRRFLQVLGSTEPQSFLSTIMHYLHSQGGQIEFAESDDEEEYDDYEDDDYEPALEAEESDEGGGTGEEVRFIGEEGEMDYDFSIYLPSQSNNPCEDENNDDRDEDYDSDDVPLLVEDQMMEVMDEYPDISMEDNDYELEDDTGDDFDDDNDDYEDDGYDDDDDDDDN